MALHSFRSAQDGHTEDEAAAWVARRDRGLTPTEQAAFRQWLEADPRHGEWLAKHEATVRSLRVLTHCHPRHLAEPDPDLLAPQRETGWWLRPLTYAAAGVALVLGYWQWTASRAEPELADAAEIYHVPTEQRRLADGSVVDLNRGAELDVYFTPTERRVQLLRGEAHFSVAKEAARPFVVQAGEVQITALGTVFNVNLQSTAIEVLVTEGKVAVARPEKPAGLAGAEDTLAAEPAVGAPISTFVEAGHLAVLSLWSESPATRVAPVSPEEIVRLLAWQPRDLEFTDTPLAEVVAEFNRDNPVKLVIDDATLSGLPIGASFRSDNVQGFVRLLEASFHVRAERRGATIVLRRDPTYAPR